MDWNGLIGWVVLALLFLVGWAACAGLSSLVY